MRILAAVERDMVVHVVVSSDRDVEDVEERRERKLTRTKLEVHSYIN